MGKISRNRMKADTATYAAGPDYRADIDGRQACRVRRAEGDLPYAAAARRWRHTETTNPPIPARALPENFSWPRDSAKNRFILPSQNYPFVL